MAPTLVYEIGSKTIRQQPQNYLIAEWDEKKRRWICDPDGSADKELCVRVFLALFDHETRFNPDGLFLLSKVTPEGPFLIIEALCSKGLYIQSKWEALWIRKKICWSLRLSMMRKAVKRSLKNAYQI